MIKVKLYIHADERPTLPQRFIQKSLNIFLHAFLYFTGHLHLRDRFIADAFFLIFVRVVQDLPRIVDDCDIFRRQALNTVRRQINDALNLFFRQFALRLETQHNRRRCRLLILFIQAVFRQNDMDAGLFDGGDLLDRSRQFSL